MKRILGLDLGTTSIGWALVNEAKEEKEKSTIVKTGVRVIPLSSDESGDFEKGKTTSINADRTLKRGARRNLQRYKHRRELLFEILKKNNLISDETILAEEGENSTHSLWELRANAATGKISLKDFVRVLFAINKKRGYKSNRKAKDEGDGQAVDGMEVAIILASKNITPGQYVLDLLKNNKKNIPDFYRSDLQTEFDKVWKFQRQFYEDVLSDELKESVIGKNKKATWAICKDPFTYCR
ncbi:CRISPR-associated endonuclease Cas9 [hydrothermal vent metagenome]|uniref:CRISPR-associated endonuclease Cas9 n=1 Tax=hydrothermal vent metagenome TaxID=652676 RepID=A0A3B0UVF1_9ZZZZ